MRRLPLALLVTLAACGHVRYKPKGRPVAYQGSFATLPTGMRLVVYESPQVDRFMFAVSYRAGSVDDPAGKEGLAHFAEHLAFRAAPDGRGKPRLWDRLIAGGWYFNAFTSHDQTVYWQAGKPADLREALAIEAARMRDPLAGVTADDFAIERDVVVSEYRERFETDATAAELQFLAEAAFRSHAYGRVVGGTPDSLRRITLADARAFFKKAYMPAAAVLVLVSPLPPRKAAEQVLEAFGELARGDGGLSEEPVRYEPPHAPPAPEGSPPLVERHAPVSQPHLWVGWVVPGWYSRRVPYAEAAAVALRHAFRTGMGNELRLQEAITDFQVGVHLEDGAGLLWVRVGLTSAGDAEMVLDRVKTAAFRARADDSARVRSDIVKATRDRLLTQGYLRMEQLDAPAISQFFRATGDPDYVGGWQKLVAVQLSYDIDSYANENLTRDRAISVLVLPDQNVAAGALIAAVGGATGTRDLEDLEEEASALPAPGADRVLATARPPGLDVAERRVLANGLTAVVAKRGSLPVADVRLVIRTDPEGSPDVPVGLPLVARISSVAGFAGLGQQKIGASLFERFSTEYVLVGDRGSSANLGVLLEDIGQWATGIRVWTFEPVKRFLRRAVEVWERDVVWRAGRAFWGRLFPGHPYGTLFPGAEGVESLREGQADDWIDREIRPQRAVLFVVSDEPPSPELWAAIDGEFGGWRAKESDPVSVQVPPLPRRSVILVDRPGATQASITIGFRAPPASERDEPATRALRWLFSSRLNRRIRVEDGVSYGVAAQVFDRRRGAALVVGAAVDREAAGRTLALMLEAARSLADRPGALDAVNRARWQVARSFGFAFDTVGSVARALEQLPALGLPPEYYETMPASIASLTPERVQAAARALALGREVVVVVADSQAVLPQLRRAGLEPELLPAVGPGEASR